MELIENLTRHQFIAYKYSEQGLAQYSRPIKPLSPIKQTPDKRLTRSGQTCNKETVRTTPLDNPIQNKRDYPLSEFHKYNHELK